MRGLKYLLNRLVEIIRTKGIKEFIGRVHIYLLCHPIIDELRWYLINHLWYSSPSIILREVQGSKMLLDLSDRGICKDFFLYGIRERECTRIFKKELEDGIKVMDIGANIGYYTLIVASIVGDSGKVYAVEPEPKNFEILKKNIELNSYKNVELYNMAIGDENGDGLLVESGYSNLHRVAKTSDYQKMSTERIRIVTVDEFLGNRLIDFIKMDVEGFEYYIIKGMTKTLNKNMPLKLFIEVHPENIRNYYGESVETMLEILSSANFKLKYLVTKEIRPSLVLPYLKGNGYPSEKSIKYEKTLKDLLKDKNMKKIFIESTVYTLFLEKKSSNKCA